MSIRVRLDQKFYAATKVDGPEDARKRRLELLPSVYQAFMDPKVFERRRNSTEPLQMYKKKDPAALHACLVTDPYNPSRENPYFMLPVFAESKPHASGTFFVLGSFKRVFDMRIAGATSPSLYEIISMFAPCHIHFDFDADIKHNPRLADPNAEKQLFDLFVSEIIAFTDKTFVADVNLDPKDKYVNVYKSAQTPGKRKMSYHLVVKLRKYAMANNYHVGAFVRRFELEMIRKYGNPDELVPHGEDGARVSRNPFFVFDSAGRLGFVVDLAIYTLDRNFRALLCDKAVEEEPRPKKYIGRAIVDDSGTVQLTDVPEGASHETFEAFLDSLVTYVHHSWTLLACPEASGSVAVSTSKLRVMWWCIDEKLYPKPKNAPGSSSIAHAAERVAAVKDMLNEVIVPTRTAMGDDDESLDSGNEERVHAFGADALRAIVDRYPCYNGAAITRCTLRKSPAETTLANPNVGRAGDDSDGADSPDGYRYALYLTLNSKFCPLLGHTLNTLTPAEHRSNHVWLIVFLDTLEVIFKCYDGSGSCGMAFRNLPVGAKSMARVKIRGVSDERRTALWNALGYSAQWQDAKRNSEALAERRDIATYLLPSRAPVVATAPGHMSWAAKVCARALFDANSTALFDFEVFLDFVSMLVDERDSNTQTQRVFNARLTTYCRARSSHACACGQPVRTLYALCRQGIVGTGFQTYVSDILIKAQVESPLSVLHGNALCFYCIDVCLACWKSDFRVETVEQHYIDALVRKFKALPPDAAFLLTDFNLSVPH